MSAVLFPLGVRLSTWLAIAAFFAVELYRRDRVSLYALIAWLFSFEAVFEATQLAFGHDKRLGPIHVVFWLVLAAVLLPILWRHGARPFWPILAGALLVWAVWVETGFQVNEHTSVALDVPAEVLNETAKTLWAAAYLLPLRDHGASWRSARHDGRRERKAMAS